MDETRVALIGIIVSNGEAAEKINAVFHDYREYIIGRMGLPYKERWISIISITMDVPQSVLSAVAGKLGMIKHVSSKTIYARLPE